MIRIRYLLAALVMSMPGITIAQPARQAIDQLVVDREIRARLARLLKEQVGLTDAQIARVQELHARIDERRRALLMQERQARGALREEVTLGDSSRNGIIAQFMDQLFKSQRERLLLTEEEQKQLAQFLTPLQRAKYFALEESVRRLLSQMMQQAADSAAGRGGRGNPPA